jgi:hypothetical protein
MAKGAEKKSKAGPRDEAKRLTPKPEVLRSLYLLSGNLCAMPDCDHVLINNAGTMIGKICHIEAAEKGGARFNERMSNEDRRAAANLILLCSPHHDVIDDKKNERTWPVSRLQTLKREHEDRFREIGETLRRAYQEQFKDTTAATSVQRPKNLARLLAHPLYNDLTPTQQRELRKHLEKYADQLQIVPAVEREFMLAIVERALRLKRNDMASVNVNDVHSALAQQDQTSGRSARAV